MWCCSEYLGQQDGVCVHGDEGTTVRLIDEFEQ